MWGWRIACYVFCVFLASYTLVASPGFDRLNDADSAAGDHPTKRRVWVNLEYGAHTGDVSSKNGTYKKISLELPVADRLSITLLVDGYSHDGSGSAAFGLGFNFMLNDGKYVDLLMTPSILLNKSSLGLLLPATFGYRVFDDKVRLQISAAYRTLANFSEGGGASSMLTLSAGIGLNLSDILPRNSGH